MICAALSRLHRVDSNLMKIATSAGANDANIAIHRRREQSGLSVAYFMTICEAVEPVGDGPEDCIGQLLQLAHATPTAAAGYACDLEPMQYRFAVRNLWNFRSRGGTIQCYGNSFRASFQQARSVRRYAAVGRTGLSAHPGGRWNPVPHAA